MANDAEKAARLKEDGNKHFGIGNHAIAESLYSKAIIADDSNPTLYTNRAMARIKLKQYDSAISDCHASIKLSSANMKAYFILSQCLLALRDFDGALASGLQAHRLGSETNDKSLAQLTTQVLACKKARWDNWEKKRSREGQELECDVISLMQRERGSLMTSCAHEYEQTQIMDEWNQKINLLRATFEKARAESEKKRTVPDWAIDDIGFGIMLDPVITKTGKSYERASILEALRRHPIDPLTREPLQVSELRPNLALRQACEEFLEENGWAVDW